MSRVYLISPPGEMIYFRERLGCGDENAILVKDSDGNEFEIPKSNIAYIER
jgi:hypothetical protein